MPFVLPGTLVFVRFEPRQKTIGVVNTLRHVFCSCREHTLRHDFLAAAASIHFFLLSACRYSRHLALPENLSSSLHLRIEAYDHGMLAFAMPKPFALLS
jgi:hypothetical protein